MSLISFFQLLDGSFACPTLRRLAPTHLRCSPHMCAQSARAASAGLFTFLLGGPSAGQINQDEAGQGVIVILHIIFSSLFQDGGDGSGFVLFFLV